MVNDQSPIIAEGGKDPCIGHTPHSAVHTILVLFIGVDYTILWRGSGTAGESLSAKVHACMGSRAQVTDTLG